MALDTRIPESWRLGEDFVPRGRYIDREFLELEYERLFPRLWQMACREQEIPEVGCHLEYQIGDQSIAIVRGESGIKARPTSHPRSRSSFGLSTSMNRPVMPNGHE